MTEIYMNWLLLVLTQHLSCKPLLLVTEKSTSEVSATKFCLCFDKSIGNTGQKGKKSTHLFG